MSHSTSHSWSHSSTHSSASGTQDAPYSAYTGGPVLEPAHDWRRAHRNSVDPMIGGVASGLAMHLGVSPRAVRYVFLGACLVNGLGAVLYAALWMFLPSDARFEGSTPGLDSAARDGRRPGIQRRLADLGPVAAFAVMGVGLLLTLQFVFGVGALLWPLALAAAGIVLLWRQADEAQRERWFDVDGRLDPVRAVLGGGTWAAWARILAGLGLVIAAVSTFAVGQAGFGVAREVWIATLLGIAGVAVVVSPWLLRLAADLGAERAERIRSQERADMAAHLHDSVLQTLALIQRNADDPATVVRLARGQERDLRAWLYTGEDADATSLAGALRAIAARVEDEHGLAVDLVTVGDCDVVEVFRPVVQAVGEALTNVVKHAKVERVSVYAECGEQEVEVFVRDRGVGFDLAQVPDDRLGVSGSIVSRMERHGGRAEVRSAPGEGTEVRLAMPLAATGPRRADER